MLFYHPIDSVRTPCYAVIVIVGFVVAGVSYPKVTELLVISFAQTDVNTPCKSSLFG